MPRSGASSPDLHGNAADKARAALLIIDMINAFDFEDAERMLDRAVAAAHAIRALKVRARAAGIPAVYVNDNFGRWRSDFRALLARVMQPGCRGSEIAKLLEPDEDDYFVLKPKHTGFQFSALDLLLEHLGAHAHPHGGCREFLRAFHGARRVHAGIPARRAAGLRRLGDG